MIPEPENPVKLALNFGLSTDSAACGNCSMYDNGRCSLVPGIISPDMVCDAFRPIQQNDFVVRLDPRPAE